MMYKRWMDIGSSFVGHQAMSSVFSWGMKMGAYPTEFNLLQKIIPHKKIQSLLIPLIFIKEDIQFKYPGFEN